MRARRFRPDGVAIGDDFQISQNLNEEVGFADVAVDSRGNAFFVWQAVDLTTENNSVGGQYFSNGTLLPSDLLVNTYTTGSQVAPVVAGPLSDGTVLAAWYSTASPGNDNSELSVVARLFRGLLPVQTIPALDQAGLLVLGLILAAAALFRIRWVRRRGVS